MGKKIKILSLPGANVGDAENAWTPSWLRAGARALPERSREHSTVECLISAYHEQALSQARVQFWFSVVAATIGFAGIVYAGLGIAPGSMASIAKLVPGAIVDAVAYLFFRQAAETRRRATELYDRLRADRQLSESAILASSIEDPHLRNVVRVQIAVHMAGLRPDSIDLAKLLEVAYTPESRK